MSERFPGLSGAQHAAEKACLVARDALATIERVDRPCPVNDWQAYALRLRGAATVLQACAIEIASCGGFVDAAYEAETSGLLDGEE